MNCKHRTWAAPRHRGCCHFDDAEHGFKQSVHPIEGLSSTRQFQDRLSFGLFKHDVKHTRDMFKESAACGGLNQLGVVLWRWRNDLFCIISSLT